MATSISDTCSGDKYYILVPASLSYLSQIDSVKVTRRKTRNRVCTTQEEFIKTKFKKYSNTRGMPAVGRETLSVYKRKMCNLDGCQKLSWAARFKKKKKKMPQDNMFLEGNCPLMRGWCHKALQWRGAELTCNIFPCYVSILTESCWILAVSCFIQGCFCLVVWLMVLTSLCSFINCLKSSCVLLRYVLL